MSLTKQAETTKPADKPLPQEILYSSFARANGNWLMHFRNPITIDDAKAVAFDFASMAADQTSLDQRVVDASDESGIRLHIISGLEDSAHSYTLTAGTEVEGAKSEIYLKAEPEAGQPKILHAYIPSAKLSKLVRNARAYERQGGFVERKPLLREKMYHKGVALGQFAAAFLAIYALKKAFPEQNAPIWLGLAGGVGWGYALLDGIYRIAYNVSIWKSGEIIKKEKKRKLLAPAVSYDRAGKH